MSNAALECVKAQMGDDSADPADVLEFLQEGTLVFSEVDKFPSRWWRNVLRVRQIGEHFIGWTDAETTGDNSPWDVGWKFDESTVCFVEPYEVTITKYRLKED